MRVRNPLLSERDGNYLPDGGISTVNCPVRNPLLSERDGNYQLQHLFCIFMPYVRNPLLSERDGNYLVQRSGQDAIELQSETHYSLKEMETLIVWVRNLTHPFRSETHYSLKEMETLTLLPSSFIQSNLGQKPTTL